LNWNCYHNNHYNLSFHLLLGLEQKFFVEPVVGKSKIKFWKKKKKVSNLRKKKKLLLQALQQQVVIDLVKLQVESKVTNLVWDHYIPIYNNFWWRKWKILFFYFEKKKKKTNQLMHLKFPFDCMWKMHNKKTETFSLFYNCFS